MKKSLRLIYITMAFFGAFFFFSENVHAEESTVLNPGEIEYLPSTEGLDDSQIQELYGDILDGSIDQEVIIPYNFENYLARWTIGSVKFSYSSGSVHWNISGAVAMEGYLQINNVTHGTSYKVGIRGRYGSYKLSTKQGNTYRVTLVAKVTGPEGQTAWIPKNPSLYWKSN